MSKPKLLLVLFLIISVEAFAQRNQVSVIGSLHRYNSDFFLTSQMKNSGQALPPGGNYKFSAGFAFDLGYSENKVYNFLFRAEYAFRSFSTEEVISSTATQPGEEYIGHYLDVSLGFKRFESISEKSKVGFGISAGAGVPLFTTHLENNFRGGDINLVERTLPFAELDFTLKKYLEKTGDDGWAMDYSFFSRAYFTPSYESYNDNDPAPPYFAFGITLKVGHVRY